MATYAALVGARDTMERLIAIRLPARTSLKLGQCARKLFDAMELLEKTRVDLVTAYGKFNDEGERETDDEGNNQWNDYDTFLKELQDALDTESDVEFTPIQLKHWPKSVELDAMEILALVDAGIIKE